MVVAAVVKMIAFLLRYAKSVIRSQNDDDVVEEATGTGIDDSVAISGYLLNDGKRNWEGGMILVLWSSR